MPAHLAFPIRFVAGVAVTVEQDSADHKRDRVNVLVRTPLGSRLDDPTFGIPDDLLRVGGVNLDALAEAVGSSEPSIAVTITRPGDEGHDTDGFVALPDRTDEIHLHIEEDG